MSQIYNTPNPKKNKHLTERERYTIEDLLKEGLRPYEIAQRLWKSTSTIEKEISRGKVTLMNSNLTYRNEYCADYAQKDYEEKAKNKGPALKIGKDHKLVKHIENKIIKEKYSPDAVIGEIKAKGIDFEAKICTKTLYNYIDSGAVFLNLTNKDLPVKKDKQKRDYKKIKICHKNLKGTSIEERPESINNREELGHWEMDCVVGKQGGSGKVLLVLSERKTREELIFKIPSKTQIEVVKILDSLESKLGKRFSERFKTITVDNGSEFLDFKGMEKSVSNPEQKRLDVYYAHPYSSWERGTNENLNKLIRRFIPKGTDIGKISKKKILYVERWMNNYPRKIFGYKTPNDITKTA